MHHNGEQFTTELRFVINQSDKYDTALLVIDGNHKGRYVVSLEKVTSGVWWIDEKFSCCNIYVNTIILMS